MKNKTISEYQNKKQASGQSPVEITKLKQMEEALRESKEKQETAPNMEIGMQGLKILDHDDNVTYRRVLRENLVGKEITSKPQTPADKPLPVDQHPLRLLLVEDSEDNRFLVQAYLKNTPYRIDTAGNGQVAVENFLSDVYDLILMDMQMPVMDGYTATREIRRLEREEGRKRTPIIALTANALREDLQKSIDAGCDVHLTKPISKQVLLETLQEFAASSHVPGERS